MTKVKTGRPKIDIDWGVFDSLCEIQCTQEEIAKVLVVSIRTLQRRCKEEREETFDSLYKKGSLGGQHSVRRAQFRMAHDIPVMAIWWGKQHLGQSDNGQPKQDDEVKPIELIRVKSMLDAD